MTDKRRSSGLRRRHWAAALALALTAGLLWGGAEWGQARASVRATDVTTMAGCDNHPGVPKWFYPVLRRAAAHNNDGVPSSWGKHRKKRRAMMKIICNESSFDVRAYNSGHYGLGQMGRVQIKDAHVTFACYWKAKNSCAHKRRYYQALAALRYAKQRYRGPVRAWNYWKAHHWW